MASFTDQIPQFNPYIQQLPVDAMVKVGMEKQQRYDMGLQKIQSQIEQVAGLQLSRPVDKEYLSSKMNELGSNLKSFAASDFSNFQLVNSVGGMVNQLSKDPFVLAGVKSTARIREQEERRKELEKQGKTDKNNDDYFNNTLNSYYSSGLQDDKGNPITFNGEYIAYTDIIKKMKEAVANAGENSSIVEELFMTEPGTNKRQMFYEQKIDPKTKQVVNVPVGFKYADVKTIEKLTTNKTAVMSAINNVLQEGDVKRQLQIDGWANYRNVSVESLITPFRKTFEETDAQLTSKGIEIATQLAGTNISPEKKIELEKMRTQVEGLKLKNSKDFSDLSAQAVNSPEAFKQNLYETQYKQNLLGQFLKDKSEKTTGVNEGKQQENWQKTYDFNIQKEATDIAQSNRDYGLKVKEFELNQLNIMSGLIKDPTSPTGYRKRTEKDKDGSISPNDARFNQNVPGTIPNTLQIVESNIENLGKDKLGLARDMYKDILSIYHNRPISDEEVKNTIKKYSKTTGETEDAFVLRQIKKLQNDHKSLGITPTPVLDSKLIRFTTTDKDHLNAILNYETVKKRIGPEKPLIINDKQVSPGDYNDLLEYDKLKKELGAAASFKQSVSSNRFFELEEKLEKKYGTLSRWFGGQNYDISGLQDYAKRLETELQPLVGVTDVIGGGLSPDEKTKLLNADMLASLTMGTRAAGASSPNGEYDRETFISYLNDPKSNVSWSIKKPKNQFEDWSAGEIIVSNSSGKTMSVEVTKDELENFTNKSFNAYVPTPIFDRLSILKTGSTNSSKIYTSPDAWQTSYFKTDDANPAVKKAGIEYHADVVPVNGGYKLAHYIKLPNKDKFSLHWDGITLTGNREELEQKVTTMFAMGTPNMIMSLAKK